MKKIIIVVFYSSLGILFSSTVLTTVYFHDWYGHSPVDVLLAGNKPTEPNILPSTNTASFAKGNMNGFILFFKIGSSLLHNKNEVYEENSNPGYYWAGFSLGVLFFISSIIFGYKKTVSKKDGKHRKNDDDRDDDRRHWPLPPNNPKLLSRRAHSSHI